MKNFLIGKSDGLKCLGVKELKSIGVGLVDERMDS